MKIQVLLITRNSAKNQSFSVLFFAPRAQEHVTLFKLSHVPGALEYVILQHCEEACVCLPPKPVFGRSAAKHTGPRVGPERAAEAVEAVRSDRITSPAAAKTSDIFVGSLQKRISGSASKAANGVSLGTVLRRYMMRNERLGSVTNVRHSTLVVTDEHQIWGDDRQDVLHWVQEEK